MYITIGEAIGPWIIQRIIDNDKLRCIAVVTLENNPEEEWIIKIQSIKTEYKFILKYGLAKYGVKVPDDESISFGRYKKYFYWHIMEKFDTDCFKKNTFTLNESEFVKSVITFLKYLHREHKVIHGDIKLQNILYKDGRYAVCDYEAIREPELSTVCDESDYDNYYYYSYGAEYGKPVFSFRYDLNAVGYMLMVIYNNYELLTFQKVAHVYYRNKSFDNNFDELDEYKKELKIPDKLQTYFKIIERVDWSDLEPPAEEIYDEIIQLFSEV